MIKYRDFIPKSVVCFQEGYSSRTFFKDLWSGICIGIIAIPLALAFAIASGVNPEQGLYTAIVAGFLISLVGGSRVQIGGPTGAFVVLIFAIMGKFGYSGLALATLIAGVLLLVMGFAHLGSLLKYIPHPVIVGFTTGIAFVIFTSQVSDFLGLNTPTLPPECLGKWAMFGKYWNTAHLSTFLVALSTLLSIIALKKYFPRLPGTMIALLAATIATAYFHLPLETIGTRFGEIPRLLPRPSIPIFSFELFIAVFPSAVTVAFLAALESLLSASIADTATGYRHRSNIELIAQGLGNIGSAFFGGIPATGAIARTRANIQLGGQTPIAGMIHSLTILLLMLFFAPFVSQIPICALAGILVYVAWMMSELPHFLEIIKGPKGDAIPLLLTCLLTIVFDLTIAIGTGILISALIFLKRMTDQTTLTLSPHSPPNIAVLEWNGPLFYSVSHLLEDGLSHLKPSQKVCVLHLNKTPLIDATGTKALKRFDEKCREKDVSLMIVGPHPHLFAIHKNHQTFTTLEEALACAKKESPECR